MSLLCPKCKFCRCILLSIPLGFLILAFSPGLMDVDPKPYKTVPANLSGALATNEKLNTFQALNKGELDGPESMAIREGKIYTGVADGRIMVIEAGKVRTVARIGEKCNGFREDKSCSRPLGLRFDDKGTLYVADAYKGIVKVDIATGKSTILVRYGTLVDGRPIKFADDLALDAQGNIYFTDLSYKWGTNEALILILERSKTGRVIKFDPVSKKLELVVADIVMANGIQLTKNEDALLYVETGMYRVMRYHLKGAKAGTLDVFALLPYFGDNIRLSSKGTYWVAGEGKPCPIGLYMEDWPIVRKVLLRYMDLVEQGLDKLIGLWPHPLLLDAKSKIEKGAYVQFGLPTHPVAIELDANGKVLQSLHSPDNKIGTLSEVQEHSGHLYLGSWMNQYIAKVKL